MGKSKGPKPPDPKEVGANQTATNVATAIAQQNLNNVNQRTPFGDLTYNQIDTFDYTDPVSGETYNIPRYEAVQTLDPSQQVLFDKSNETKGNLLDLASERSGFLRDHLREGRVDISNLPEGGSATGITKSYGGDFSAERQRVEDALIARQDRHFGRDREALEARLANRGIRLGSQGYAAAQDVLGTQQNDARLAAIAAAGQEHSRLAGLERDRASFGNRAQQQLYNQLEGRRAARFGELAYERSSPINEITALLSGSQIQRPQYVNPAVAQLPTTDHAGLAYRDYDARVQRHQFQQQQQQQLLGGIFGLASAGITGGLF